MLQTTTNINIDFYDKKYILINAKQFDRDSRSLFVTCYNHGELYSINNSEHAAYIRYRKADNNSVFNFCEINHKGKIIVELTEQMLAADGICCADLVIVNKGGAEVNSDTGEIVGIENTSILSTMPLHIDVTGTATENSNIESSYEFSGLNTALEKAEAEYTEVILTSKSWAIGNTGIRDGENTDNAKYYASQASNSASAANTSALNAAESERVANEHMDKTLEYSGNAYTYMNNASKSETNAYNSASAASESASAAKTSEQKAKVSETNALSSMDSATNSASSASTSATNAYNYYLQVEAITNGLNGAFLPMGTIEYAELAVLKENGVVAAGYLYNISDNFTTDETFKMGAGIEYEAGTNVYYTADGYWDCLAGATVTGIKGDAETTYRKGNVNLTANNIGAISTADMVTVDEIKNYLDI